MSELDKKITLFAETNFRGQRKRFGIKIDDRRRHMYLLGKTGMGKSTILENMIIDDLRNGNGVAVVDPHGDLVEKVINFVPNNRINDVIYFNPADIDHPIAFNVLEKVSQEHKHLVASGLIGVFKKLWADSWGPRLEHFLRNTILALLDYNDSTLLGVNRMLTDKAFRNKVVAKVQDPVVKAFWTDEFTKLSQSFASEAVAPIQNKVGQFLSSSLIRNIVGQVKSTINMREIMDSRKILLMNLSKGRIGEDNSALLGSMMITKIQLAAMSRVDTPEEEREDFFLYVDEFQNFATESFANILSEARKYRLCLVLAHQYIEQLGELVSAAVFGNVGTMISFRVGAADADFLEKEFAPTFTPEDLVNLAKYEVYLKLMIDGVASQPFSARGLPPLSGTTNNFDKILKVSRERYSNPRSLVEDKIMRWSQTLLDTASTSDEAFGKKKRRPNMFDSNCAICKKDLEVPFQPDGLRPIFCEDCLPKARDIARKKGLKVNELKMSLFNKDKKEEVKTAESKKEGPDEQANKNKSDQENKQSQEQKGNTEMPANKEPKENNKQPAWQGKDKPKQSAEKAEDNKAKKENKAPSPVRQNDSENKIKADKDNKKDQTANKQTQQSRPLQQGQVVELNTAEQPASLASLLDKSPQSFSNKKKKDKRLREQNKDIKQDSAPQLQVKPESKAETKPETKAAIKAEPGQKEKSGNSNSNSNSQKVIQLGQTIKFE